MDKVMVIKIGGATLGSHDTTIEDIVSLQQQGKPMVVVHGGGKLITDWLSKLGISPRFVQGERVTDSATLEVVIAVLAGVVNKEIVASINSQGGWAIGISGVDGRLIQSKIKYAELGYTGAVVKVNKSPLEVLLHAGYVPVVSPLSLNVSAKQGDTSQMLNVNADLAAGEIAAALGAEKLIFLTDVAGVCGRSGKLVSRLSSGEAEALIASGVASGGMIPKIKACLIALESTSTTRIIDGRQPHALFSEVEGHGGGTTIYKD